MSILSLGNPEVEGEAIAEESQSNCRLQRFGPSAYHYGAAETRTVMWHIPIGLRPNHSHCPTDGQLRRGEVGKPPFPKEVAESLLGFKIWLSTRQRSRSRKKAGRCLRKRFIVVTLINLSRCQMRYAILTPSTPTVWYQSARTPKATCAA